MLITPVHDGPDSRLEQLIARGTPVVLVDRGSGHHNRCSVAVDDVLGGRLAAAHLREQEHTSIAYVGGPASSGRSPTDRPVPPPPSAPTVSCG